MGVKGAAQASRPLAVDFDMRDSNQRQATMEHMSLREGKQPDPRASTRASALTEVTQDNAVDESMEVAEMAGVEGE